MFSHSPPYSSDHESKVMMDAPHDDLHRRISVKERAAIYEQNAKPTHQFEQKSRPAHEFDSRYAHEPIIQQEIVHFDPKSKGEINSKSSVIPVSIPETIKESDKREYALQSKTNSLIPAFPFSLYWVNSIPFSGNEKSNHSESEPISQLKLVQLEQDFTLPLDDKESFSQQNEYYERDIVETRVEDSPIYPDEQFFPSCQVSLNSKCHSLADESFVDEPSFEFLESKHAKEILDPFVIASPAKSKVSVFYSSSQSISYLLKSTARLGFLIMIILGSLILTLLISGMMIHAESIYLIVRDYHLPRCDSLTWLQYIWGQLIHSLEKSCRETTFLEKMLADLF